MKKKIILYVVIIACILVISLFFARKYYIDSLSYKQIYNENEPPTNDCPDVVGCWAECWWSAGIPIRAGSFKVDGGTCWQQGPPPFPWVWNCFPCKKGWQSHYEDIKKGWDAKCKKKFGLCQPSSGCTCNIDLVMG